MLAHHVEYTSEQVFSSNMGVDSILDGAETDRKNSSFFNVSRYRDKQNHKLDIEQKNMQKDSCSSVHDNGFMGIDKG